MSDINKILTIILTIVLFFVVVFFLWTAFSAVIRPLYLDISQGNVGVSLDTSLDETVDYLRQREERQREGLTVSSPSATLIEEEKNAIPEGR